MAETNSFSDSPASSASRIPPKYFNIQYNFCKNPTCLNFDAVPSSAVCWLTEHDSLDEDHVAWLYNRVSLHAADVFFEKVRRSLSPLKRSINVSAA